MALDDRAFGQLIEESQDLHSDAMRTTHASLEHMVETRREQPSRDDHDSDASRRFAQDRRRLLTRGVMGAGGLAAAGFGAALLSTMSSPAFADQSMDVQMLQTAASIENLAVATYDTDRIRERASLIGYGIDARRQRFPDETPFVYQPHRDEGLSYRWDGAAKVAIKDYNLLDLSI